MKSIHKKWLLIMGLAFLALVFAHKFASSQQSYSFTLGSESGSRKEVTLTIAEPAILKAVATWSRKDTKLTLILNGPGQVGYYARKDGSSPLTLEFEVSPELVARGNNWLISIVKYGKGTSIDGSLTVTISRKATLIPVFPSVKPSTAKAIGIQKDFLEIPISRLKGRVASNYGKKEIPSKIRIKGYYYYDRVPMIVSNPRFLEIDSPLPEDSYVVLRGRTPPKSEVGKMLLFSGQIQMVKDRVVFDVIDTSPVSTKPVFTYIPGKLEILGRIVGIHPRKFAVIISGGIDDVNNHSRYWNNVKFIYNVLKVDYGFSEANIYVLYYDGTAEDNTVTVDYSCTLANLQTVFNELRTKMTSFDLLFLYATNHGGGYKSAAAAGPLVGYHGGRVVFTGNEGNEVRESSFALDGHDSDGNQLEDNFGYWFDFDGDGVNDDVLLNRDGTLRVFVNGDPDGDYFIENDDVDGEDSDNDFIVDADDGGVDLNDDGDKNDWVGIDEVLNLLGEEQLFDDELSQMLQNISSRVIITAMGQCFSGGFINDLMGQDRIIITSASSWEYAWATDDLQHSEFIYHFSLGLNKVTFSFPAPFRSKDAKMSILFADADRDGKISIAEAFNYALSLKTKKNTASYEDSGIAPAQTQSVPRGGDGNLGTKVVLE